MYYTCMLTIISCFICLTIEASEHCSLLTLSAKACGTYLAEDFEKELENDSKIVKTLIEINELDLSAEAYELLLTHFFKKLRQISSEDSYERRFATLHLLFFELLMHFKDKLHALNKKELDYKDKSRIYKQKIKQLIRTICPLLSTDRYYRCCCTALDYSEKNRRYAWVTPFLMMENICTLKSIAKNLICDNSLLPVLDNYRLPGIVSTPDLILKLPSQELLPLKLNKKLFLIILRKLNNKTITYSHVNNEIDLALNQLAQGKFAKDTISYLEAAYLYLKLGADINNTQERSWTPLIFAAWNNQETIVKLLLQAKADVNKKTSFGGTALIAAAQKGNNAIAQLLIQHGADVNAATSEGITPLELAVKDNNLALVKILLTTGASVKSIADNINKEKIELSEEMKKILHWELYEINEYGWPPLVTAAYKGNFELVMRLIEADTDINKPTPNGGTPLLAAAQKGHADIVLILLQRRAKVNASTNVGITPLYIAAQEGHITVVQLLLEHGADPYIKNLEGLLPLDIAFEKGKHDIVNLLLNLPEQETLLKD